MHGSDSKSLDECSTHEIATLTAIVALALTLPKDLIKYIRAIGEIRAEYFDRPGRKNRRTPAGLIDGHEPRATGRWADLRTR